MAERKAILRTSSRVKLGLASDEWLVACVRRGDTAAFEALYDRHVRELLGFALYMLHSRQDAEDAVQATFASAYRALRADSRPVALRPWLFTIARNESLSILRRRKTVVELNGEVPARNDPVDEIERREEVRRVFEGLRELPESQRAALVLAEVHGLSHREVGDVIGVRAGQVKAYVYQARTTLVSERAARDADCREIREELASARGAALLRGRLRRHVRTCPDCRTYADGVARQRRQLGALLPVMPSLALKYRALEAALGVGSADPVAVAGGATVGATAAGTAFEFAGGGINAIICKVAVGVACVGASAGVGASVLGSTPSESAPSSASAAVVTAAKGPLVAATALRISNAVRAMREAAGLSGGEASGAGRNASSTGGRGAGRGGRNGTLLAGDQLNAVDNGRARPGPAHEQGRGQRGGPKEGATSWELERRASAERHQALREGKALQTAERRRRREERLPRQARPPRTEEEIRLKREEARRHREEQGPESASGAPKTEEEIRLKREHNEQVRAEKRKLREEEARREAEAPTP